MQIDIDVLITWGGITKKVAKDTTIFFEGEEARGYYQIVSGSVRLCNENSDGKEFTQGLFFEGDSFGEPPLILSELYPCTAITMTDSVLIKLSREKFLLLMEEYPSIEKDLLKLFALRIYNKSVNIRSMMNTSPESRIMGFLSQYKKRTKGSNNNSPILIPFTRQQIANFTGLRVETVIRTLLKMSELNKVNIINRKLFY